MGEPCLHKVAYESQRRARQVARIESRRTGEVIRAYPCTACGAWHIGHSSTRGRRPKSEAS